MSLTYGIALMVVLVLSMAIIDTRRVTGRANRQVVLLDHAIADEAALRHELSARLGGEVLTASVQRLDFVNDTTLVDVRFRATDGDEDGARRAAPGPVAGGAHGARA